MTNTGICPRTDKFKKILSRNESKNKLIYEGDIVFGMSREVLNWGVMHARVGGVSSVYNVFVVNKQLVPFNYLEEFMREHIQYFSNVIRPAAREGQGIDRHALFSKMIYMPPISVYETYLLSKNLICFSLQHYYEEANILASLRNALLPKLMSGEIDVSDVRI